MTGKISGGRGSRERECEWKCVHMCMMEKNEQVNKTKQQKTAGKNIRDPMSQLNFKFLGKIIQNKLISSTWKIILTSSQKEIC